MPLIEILVLVGIVLAFAGFGLVLAWGDAQTRHLEGWLQANHPVRSGRSRVGLAWSGVLSLLRVAVPSE